MSKLSLEDLNLHLLPDWVKDDQDSSNKYANYEGESRGPRGKEPHQRGQQQRERTNKPNARRGPGPGGQKPFQRKGPPSSDRPAPSDQQRERRDFSGKDKAGYQGKNRASAQGGRSFNQRPQKRAPLGPQPIATEFHPEDHFVESVISQLRQAPVAYPVFDVARLFLDQAERYRVQVKPREVAPEEKEQEEPLKLYRLKGSTVFAGRRENLLPVAFDKYAPHCYLQVEEETEEIKGQFQNVARCQKTGVLLGPTSHHSYQTALRRHYDERLSRSMSFEKFKAQIETVSDPELIEQWKTEARRKVLFYARPDFDPSRLEGTESQEQLNPSPQETPEAAAPTVEAGALPESQEVVANFTPDPSETAPALSAEDPATEPAATTDPSEVVDSAPAEDLTETVEPSEAPVAAESDSDSSEASPEQGTTEAADSTQTESTADAESPRGECVGDQTLARDHFSRTYANYWIEECPQAEIAGKDIAQIPDHVIRRSIGLLREEEARFPVNLSRHLSTAFSRHGLHLFKHQKKILHVTSAKPAGFTGDLSQLSPGAKAILLAVRAKPDLTRPDLAGELIGKPPYVGASEEDVKAALAANLRWLVECGMVVQFANGSLYSPSSPKTPPPAAKPKGPKSASPDRHTTSAQASSESVPTKTETPPAAPLQAAAEPQQNEQTQPSEPISVS